MVYGAVKLACASLAAGEGLLTWRSLATFAGAGGAVAAAAPAPLLAYWVYVLWPRWVRV